MNPSRRPIILSLDAAGNACSAALWAQAGIVAHRFEAMERGHAEVLVPMAEAVVAETGFSQIDLVAVSTGPGAYTGLRIAIAVARGLGLALGVPVMGIGSLDVHLHAARRAGAVGPVAVLLETKRSDFYFQAFGVDNTPLFEPAVVSAGDVKGLLAEKHIAALAGDAVDRFAGANVVADAMGRYSQDADAAIVAALAAALAAQDDIGKIPPPRPMYLRPPDTTPPAADRQRLRG